MYFFFCFIPLYIFNLKYVLHPSSEKDNHNTDGKISQ
jgi:hypothetical protein